MVTIVAGSIGGAFLGLLIKRLSGHPYLQRLAFIVGVAFVGSVVKYRLSFDKTKTN